MKKNILIFALLVLGFGSIVWAAPYFQQTAGFVPLTTNTYYIGTSTPSLLEYKGIFTKDLTVSGTCTGCGSGSAFPFTPTTWGVSTSTTVGFLNGIIVNSASSTITYASTTAITVAGTAYFPGSGIWNSTGSVGIGTTSPWGRLSVTGAGTGTGIGFLVADSANSPKMVVLDNGNVGIGTTSPGTLLSIGGNATGWNFQDGTTATSTGSGNLHIKGNLQVDGNFFAPVTLVTSGDVTIDGALTVTGQTTLATSLTGVLLGTSGVVSNASVQTCTNQFVRAMSASYVATCATVANTDLANSTISGIALGSNLADLTATDATLTFSGTYTGATARTIGLNLANANTWTGGQIFGNATTTRFNIAPSATLTTPIGGDIGIDTTTGQLRYSDVTGTVRVLSGDRSLVLSSATTTAWTASSSGPYLNVVVAPFAGTIKIAKCTTDVGTLNVDIYHTTTHLALLNASTTVGTFTFSSNNTFTAGEKIYMSAGTPASAPTSVSCTLSVTETAD